MNHRLATEYAQSRLELTENDFTDLRELFESHQVSVTLTSNRMGFCEVAAKKEFEVIRMDFRKLNGRYVFEGDLLVFQKELVHAMRAIVARFKGSTIINRIYDQFTMSYHYEQGAVVRIEESNGQSVQKILDRPHQNGESIPSGTATATQEYLNRLFCKNDVEMRISDLRRQIDEWLDIRIRLENTSRLDEDQLHAVDKQLSKLSDELIRCETI